MLDIMTWAYLKEELVNTPDSKEVVYLKANFKNLIDFTTRMDSLSPSVKPLKWNTDKEFVKEVVNSMFMQN
jgi:hypothetical protein